jgi:hypothetical protein
MARFVNCLLSGVSVFRFAGVGIDRFDRTYGLVNAEKSMQRSVRLVIGGLTRRLD